ncbi:MAG TPA: DUF924 family protein [Burkholderiales bacterium]|nr:DUF924 family protein [Burkholderiales bacterium]
METVDTILQFWFGAGTDDAEVARERNALWWKKSAETDARIRDRFAGLVDEAVDGRRDEWLSDARGRLAMIILTDQFSRNMYRDTPRAFANDHLALKWCKDGLAIDVHRLLKPIERVFFYLPLEHSESLEDQDRSVALFTELANSVPEDQREPFAGFVDYAVRHREVIKQFGRFSHRNAILGRVSSERELAFLKQPGSSF